MWVLNTYTSNFMALLCHVRYVALLIPSRSNVMGSLFFQNIEDEVGNSGIVMSVFKSK